MENELAWKKRDDSEQQTRGSKIGGAAFVQNADLSPNGKL
jgi:hypothetical protein